MPLHARIRGRADRAAASGTVRYSAADADWVAHAECSDCGGYALPLRVFDATARELAGERGHAFLTRVHARGCLGCQARVWRTRPEPPGPGPYVWWDTDAREWMAWGTLAESGRGVSLPLGIRTFWAPHEVRAAARALWSGSELPLRVATDPADLGESDSAVFHDARSGRWRLRVACFDCGGFDLPLMSFGRGAVEASVEEALDCLELVAREGCPHCRTLYERTAAAVRDGEEPRLWYDTGAGDWLLWQAVDDVPGGVTLPLGLGRFDAPRTAVYQSAAPLLFGSELFLDEGP